MSATEDGDRSHSPPRGILKRVQSGRFRPNLKSTLRRERSETKEKRARSKTETKEKRAGSTAAATHARAASTNASTDTENRKSSRQNGVPARLRKVMSGRFEATNPRASASSIANKKERGVSNASTSDNARTLSSLARTTSALSMHAARTAGTHARSASARLQGARDRATDAANTAATRASDYAATLSRSVSEKVAQARGSASVGDPLEPHPHKGLLRHGNEIEDHLWLLLNLPDHNDLVTCVGFSANGLFVASSGGPEDCSILLTYRNTMKLGRALTRTARLRVSDRDFVSAFSFSPSSTHLICALSMRKVVSVYKLTRRPDAIPSLEASFSTHHTYPINSVAMRDTAALSYILTCADDGDNQIKVWGLEGRPICAFETDEVSNRKASVSPDGRLVTVVAHLSTAVQLLKVAPVEVGRYKKKGVELEAVGFMDGSGEGAIRDITLSADNAAAYMCTEDGHWSKYSVDTNCLTKPHKVVEYASKEEATQFSAVTCNADGSLVICARGRDVVFIRSSGSSAVFGKIVGTIKDAHDSDIASIHTSPESDCLVTCGVDSVHARVWQMPRA